jgi:aspartate ammonia-lyase
VAAGADVLIGVSAAGAFSPELIELMARKPIVFALANPDPEIMPEAVLAVAPDAIVATGRSDRPNQINNVLAFPFVFRGALDARARQITPSMRVAAVRALASLTTDEGSLLPSPFDPRLLETIAPAVAAASASTSEHVYVPHFTRVEVDPLGDVEVPEERLFGAQTQRAVTNFPLSGISVASMPDLIRALAWVKKAAALANREIGELAPDVARWIVRACDEVAVGRWDAEFVVDVLQGGAGTSTNMNANEVIANRALELAGFRRGDYTRIHPNDHVNRSQSTNDAYATAVRLSVFEANRRLLAQLVALAKVFEAKASQFEHIPKLGRTQLQDAVPMTLGQEFGAFATTVAEDADRGAEMGLLFLEVNLGGTAIGTGAGASGAYRAAVVAKLRQVSDLPVIAAENLIEATWDMGAFVLYSGFLKRVASKLSKIANDLRLLSSGPRGGFGEIILPQRQPGSSLMPGKVNPVIPEAVNAAAFKVFGLDTAITFAAEAGQLQLNAFEPVIVSSLHEGIGLLTNAIRLLIDNCLLELTADASSCRSKLDASTALATHLVPEIGYGRAAEVAKRALRGGTLREAVIALEPGALHILDEAFGHDGR